MLSCPLKSILSLLRGGITMLVDRNWSLLSYLFMRIIFQLRMTWASQLSNPMNKRGCTSPLRWIPNSAPTSDHTVATSALFLLFWRCWKTRIVSSSFPGTWPTGWIPCRATGLRAMLMVWVCEKEQWKTQEGFHQGGQRPAHMKTKQWALWVHFWATEVTDRTRASLPTLQNKVLFEQKRSLLPLAHSSH